MARQQRRPPIHNRVGGAAGPAWQQQQGENRPLNTDPLWDGRTLCLSARPRGDDGPGPAPWVDHVRDGRRIGRQWGPTPHPQPAPTPSPAPQQHEHTDLMQRHSSVTAAQQALQAANRRGETQALALQQQIQLIHDMAGGSHRHPMRSISKAGVPAGTDGGITGDVQNKPEAGAHRAQCPRRGALPDIQIFLLRGSLLDTRRARMGHGFSHSCARDGGEPVDGAYASGGEGDRHPAACKASAEPGRSQLTSETEPCGENLGGTSPSTCGNNCAATRRQPHTSPSEGGKPSRMSSSFGTGQCDNDFRTQRGEVQTPRLCQCPRILRQQLEGM